MVFADLSIEELRAFKPDVREPADFDAFWKRTLADSRGAAAAPELGDVVLALPSVEVRDLTFSGFDGQPIKAWFSRPTTADAPLPVVIQYQGYGGGRGLPVEHTFWPAAGFAHVMVDTRGQGSSWGAGGDTPDDAGSGPASPGFMTRGIEDPEQYYYRRVFTDAALAVDAARTLPGVDATRAIVTGGSQGGGIALAVAGLVPDLVAAMPDVAFLCHYERGVQIADESPFTEVRKYLAVHRDRDEQVFETLSYFDGVNFASRANAPSLWSAALMDNVVPPSTTFAAFNRYGADRGVRKEMVVYPYNGHEGGDAHQRPRQLEFLHDLLG